MKASFKLFRFTAFVVVISFSIVACYNGTTLEDIDKSNDAVDGLSETYTSTKSNITYILIISTPPTKAVHSVGDNYTLTVSGTYITRISDNTQCCIR